MGKMAIGTSSTAIAQYVINVFFHLLVASWAKAFHRLAPAEGFLEMTRDLIYDPLLKLWEDVCPTESWMVPGSGLSFWVIRCRSPGDIGGHRFLTHFGLYFCDA